MKKTRIFVCSLIISGLILSCSDQFLDQQAVGVLSENNLLNPNGIEGLLVGAYSLLNGSGTNILSEPLTLLFSSVWSDETGKGSDPGDQPPMDEYETFLVTSGNTNHLDLWRHYFNGVNRCNQVLNLLPDVAGITDARRKTIEAEARFLRGHYYFYLKRAFKNIPWIDETSPDVRVPNTVDNDGATYVNIWPQIADDFNFARQNLPETQADLGRPNKWAADCYYAKVLIYRANEGELATGYADALLVLNGAITSGKTMKGQPYNLEPNYHDNFNCLKENGPECVWAIQHSCNDGTTASSQINNMKAAQWLFVLQSTSAPGLGKGWGFVAPTPWYADQFRTSGKGLPYLDFYTTNPVRLKDDDKLDAAPPGGPDPFVVDTVGLDPRIDWTMARRGIPLLDYGLFPGKSWIRNQQSDGPYITKKWCIRKSEEGVFTPPGRVMTAMNVQIIRFADVLLLAAECEAQAGSLNNARTLVNRVRQRMADNSSSDQNWVKKSDGTNAANYRVGIYPTGGPEDPFANKTSALNAILFERGLELGVEGQRYYDVVRFGRGTDLFNQYISVEKARFDVLAPAVYTEVPDRYLPIPRDAIDRSLVDGKPTLTQNPGY
jgi:hypothetical protein